ncbi:MAG: dihydroxy-acid dehydratase, partial [Bacteroidales bacterium]|nr:dihydroxy-acid dehydratase [Bacteroidales bacterium]
GGAVGLIRDKDIIDIDIPNRSINLRVSTEELNQRRLEEEKKAAVAFKPLRDRKISKALKAYVGMVSSADKGAVRIIEED